MNDIFHTLPIPSVPPLTQMVFPVMNELSLWRKRAAFFHVGNLGDPFHRILVLVAGA